MKKTDVRVVKTQKVLLDALYELIKTKKLSCISITELCSKAGINRNTFYYHYNNIYELLSENKNQLIKQINDIFNKYKTPSPDMLTEILYAIKDRPQFINILYSPNCDLDYFEEICDLASQKTAEYYNSKGFTSPKDLMICHYSNAGTNSIFRDWIKGGMKEDPEEITELISMLGRNGPITILFSNKK